MAQRLWQQGRIWNEARLYEVEISWEVEIFGFIKEEFETKLDYIKWARQLVYLNNRLEGLATYFESGEFPSFSVSQIVILIPDITFKSAMLMISGLYLLQTWFLGRVMERTANTVGSKSQDCERLSLLTDMISNGSFLGWDGIFSTRYQVCDIHKGFKEAGLLYISYQNLNKVGLAYFINYFFNKSKRNRKIYRGDIKLY